MCYESWDNNYFKLPIFKKKSFYRCFAKIGNLTNNYYVHSDKDTFLNILNKENQNFCQTFYRNLCTFV